ncbi:hypothetical protein JTE90_001023 [Oedothorax gibbosus]|uniref:GST C-terminal domain-containing protein n=1 Tax=Oedothorax gibbosus TaxID=931172 RepID=A0AAV6TPR5_9ARAC|nr:hypothetical protein JTE90_001023 [Oedothorax gibbosus]
MADRDFRDYYLVKKSGLDKIRAMIADPNEVVKAVLDVEYALNTVEKETGHAPRRDYYLVKKSGLDKIRAMIADPNEVVKAVLDVEYALNTVEKELATHQGDKKDWWLCSDKFAIADISLASCYTLPKNRSHRQILPARRLFSKTCAGTTKGYNRGTLTAVPPQEAQAFYGSSGAWSPRNGALVTIGGVAVVLAAAGMQTFLVHRSK